MSVEANRSNQYGGTGGQVFVDDLTDVSRILEIQIWYEKWVDKLYVTYLLENGQTRSISHGGSGGSKCSTLTLAADEYIVEISGKYGAWIDYLSIRTNKNSTVSGGGEAKTTDFSIGMAGKAFTGFFGASDKYLDAIGAFLTHIPTQLYAGYYTLDDVPFLEHTFVAATTGRDKVNFQCYGGLTGKELIYPCNLYPVSAIHGSPPAFDTSALVKKQPSTELRVARAIATYNLEPRVDTDYGRKDGGFLDLGDCSGVIYGLNGVCHQMANRILAAFCWDKRTLDQVAPVHSAPSFVGLSYVFYGCRGRDTPIVDLGLTDALFKDFLSEAWRRAMKEPQVSTASTQESPPMTQEILEQRAIDALRRQLAEHYQAPSSSAMITADFGDAALQNYTEARLKEIEVATQSFLDQKRDLDIKLIKGDISHEQYASAVNGAFATMIRVRAALLTPDHLKVQAAQMDLKQPLALVSPELMPTSYAKVKEMLGDI